MPLKKLFHIITYELDGLHIPPKVDRKRMPALTEERRPQRANGPGRRMTLAGVCL